MKSVIQSEFKLDNYAEQGNWRIEIEAKSEFRNFSERYDFEVEEYVLPKFEGNRLQHFVQSSSFYCK